MMRWETVCSSRQPVIRIPVQVHRGPNDGGIWVGIWGQRLALREHLGLRPENQPVRDPPQRSQKHAPLRTPAGRLLVGEMTPGGPVLPLSFMRAAIF